MKKMVLLILVFVFSGCVEMQQAINQFPQTQGIGGIDISAGLKEAFEQRYF